MAVAGGQGSPFRSLLYPDRQPDRTDRVQEVTIGLGDVCLAIGSLVPCVTMEKNHVSSVSRRDCRVGFAFTVVGLLLALVVDPRSYVLPTETGSVRDVQVPLDPPLLAISVSPLVVLPLIQRTASSKTTRLVMVAILSGIMGATVFAIDPQWTYLAAMERMSRGGDPYLEIAVAYLLAGSAVGAWSSRRLALRWFTFREMALKTVGGFMVGFGALLIPGGNEALLFWSGPSLAQHALAAYAAMMLTIAALLLWAEGLRPGRRDDM